MKVLRGYHYQIHPYHLVDPSSHPLTASIGLLGLTVGGVMLFHGYNNGGLVSILGLTVLILTSVLWWIDTVREGTFQGHHTTYVVKGLKIGMILFIVSEVMFFFSIFWAFLHSSLSVSVELGSVWPPKGIEPLNVWEVPLLNTVILLSSGATVTYSHHSLVARDRDGAIKGLVLTIALGALFTLLQGLEYYNSPFSIADGIYGTTFYFSTGFHGLHILIGSIFLIVGLVRLINYHFTSTHHVGYASAILYWHFVDVVWLFLFVMIYWWGS